MAKVNVFVPDDLYQQLERHRTRIAVSRICQEALRRELARLEWSGRDPMVEEEVIARLAKEKEEWEAKWRGAGRELALQAGPRLRYPTLRRWGRMAAQYAGKGSIPRDSLHHLEDPFWLVLEAVWGFFPGSGMEAEEIVANQGNQRELPVLGEFHAIDPWTNRWDIADYDVDSLKVGWLEGMQALWRQIEPRLDSNDTDRSATENAC